MNLISNAIPVLKILRYICGTGSLGIELQMVSERKEGRKEGKKE
jgi:hypothetical protein